MTPADDSPPTRDVLGDPPEGLLDQLTFDQLVDLARGAVPDWFERHPESGITLLESFSHLVTQLRREAGAESQSGLEVEALIERLRSDVEPTPAGGPEVRIPIDVRLVVSAESGYSAALIARQLEAEVFRGWFGDWPPGRAIRGSDISAAVQGTPGVAAIESLSVRRSDHEQDRDGRGTDVDLAPDERPVLGRLDVRAGAVED